MIRTIERGHRWSQPLRSRYPFDDKQVKGARELREAIEAGEIDEMAVKEAIHQRCFRKSARKFRKATLHARSIGVYLVTFDQSPASAKLNFSADTQIAAPPLNMSQ